VHVPQNSIRARTFKFPPHTLDPLRFYELNSTAANVKLHESATEFSKGKGVDTRNRVDRNNLWQGGPSSSRKARGLVPTNVQGLGTSLYLKNALFFKSTHHAMAHHLASQWQPVKLRCLSTIERPAGLPAVHRGGKTDPLARQKTSYVSKFNLISPKAEKIRALHRNRKLRCAFSVNDSG
jgi:hypothetical protein